jgi:hypothetical protein
MLFHPLFMRDDVNVHVYLSKHRLIVKSTSFWRSKKSAQLHTQLQQQIINNELIRTEDAERIDINHLFMAEITWQRGGANSSSTQVPDNSRYLITLPNLGSCRLTTEYVFAARTTTPHASRPHTEVIPLTSKPPCLLQGKGVPLH